MLLFAVTAFASQLCVSFYSDTLTQRGLRLILPIVLAFLNRKIIPTASVLLVLVQVFDCLGHSGLGHSGLGLSFNLSFLGLAGPRPCLEGLEGLVRLGLLFLAFQDLVHVL